MTFKYRGILGAWVLALAATIATQSAYANDLLFVSTGAATRAPIGWVEFCAERPTECKSTTSAPRDVVLNSKSWTDLVRINKWVNESVKPMTDMDHWGVVEKWSYPDDGYGDCEDYQLLKRKLLRERGLPQRAMRMTVVIDELNEGHAVLMIRTDRGDYILDNKTNAVLPWDETGYVYVKREGHDSMAWTSLGGVTSPTATANR